MRVRDEGGVHLGIEETTTKSRDTLVTKKDFYINFDETEALL